MREPLQAHRCFSSMPLHKEQEQHQEGNGQLKMEVLYRGVGMIPFRVLVRLKIFQLVGVAALAIPINTFLVQASTII